MFSGAPYLLVLELDYSILNSGRLKSSVNQSVHRRPLFLGPALAQTSPEQRLHSTTSGLSLEPTHHPSTYRNADKTQFQGGCLSDQVPTEDGRCGPPHERRPGRVGVDVLRSRKGFGILLRVRGTDRSADLLLAGERPLGHGGLEERVDRHRVRISGILVVLHARTGTGTGRAACGWRVFPCYSWLARVSRRPPGQAGAREGSDVRRCLPTWAWKSFAIHPSLGHARIVRVQRSYCSCSLWLGRHLNAC